jgi:chromosome segregation ATPase
MSLESWKNQMASLKQQLQTLKNYKSDAMKQLDSIIAAQSNAATKRDYRERKKSKKEEWDSKITYLKSQIDSLKRSKPQR